MRWIEVIEACAGAEYAYNRGIHQAPDHIARDLIKAGHAKPYKKPPEKSITRKGRKSGVSKTDDSTKL